MSRDSAIYHQIKNKIDTTTLIDYVECKNHIDHVVKTLYINMCLYNTQQVDKLICDMSDEEFVQYKKSLKDGY
jgi:hypothetical protein